MTARMFGIHVATLLALAGCGKDGANGVVGGQEEIPAVVSYEIPDEGIQFADVADANADPGETLSQLEFTNPDGKKSTVVDLASGKHLVLVITRGSTGAVCPYCSTQVAQLIGNYEEFKNRNAEVVVVYPMLGLDGNPSLDAFLTATRQRLNDPEMKAPFPVLLDLELKAVDQLGIRRDLSKPATYILDDRKQVRFAYVGSTLADRPSIPSLLKQLDALSKAGNGG